MNTVPKSQRQLILSSIRRSLLELESATKVELSDKLEISFPTISKFLTQMEKEEEITSVGLDESSGGRRAKRYTYNPEHTLGLAIFLEKTETNYTIFNCAGEVKEQGNAPSVLVDNGLHLLTELIEKIVTANPSEIRSMAIGVPGAVDHGRIFHIPGYDSFRNFDLKGYYEDYFSRPVVVENDMNVAVVGFNDNSGMKGDPSLVYLYAGHNGPGAGLMVNGKVVRGSTFFAGEVQYVQQYDEQNFGQAIKSGDGNIDATSRLIALFTATINPQTVILCNDEAEQATIEKIEQATAKYIPNEHLPQFETVIGRKIIYSG